MDRATLEAAALAALGQACHRCAHQWCQSERAAAGRVIQLDPSYAKAARVDHMLDRTALQGHIDIALALRDAREAVLRLELAT